MSFPFQKTVYGWRASPLGSPPFSSEACSLRSDSAGAMVLGMVPPPTNGRPPFSLPMQICGFPWLLHRSGLGVSVVDVDRLPWSSTALLLTEASRSVSWTVENSQESLSQGLLGKPQQAGAWHTGVSRQDIVFFSGASGGEHTVVWKALQPPRRVTSVVAKEVSGKCGNKRRPRRREPSDGH